MPRRKKQNSRSTSGFISRTRLVVASIFVLVAGLGISAYELSMYQEKVVTITDIPTVQTSDADKLAGTSTTTTLSIQSPTITPAPSSEVPTLTPTNQSSASTTSYQSTNWAGYLATGGSFTAVSGSWVIPTPTATSSTVESGDGTWIGIGGITTADLIQIGTANTISPSGIVTTAAFYELLPAGAVGIASLAVNPGDTVSASIMQLSVNQWAISLSNVTSGRSFSTTVNYTSSLSSAQWIQEDPSYPDGSLVLLDNFGIVQFSNATLVVNGTTMAAAASNVSPITLIGQGGAKGHGGTPSQLNGSSFIVTYY